MPPFDIGESLRHLLKRKCLVDDDLQLSLFDEFAKLSEFGAAWMHEEAQQKAETSLRDRTQHAAVDRSAAPVVADACSEHT